MQSTPVYVQQSFMWDEGDSNSAVAVKPITSSVAQHGIGQRGVEQRGVGQRGVEQRSDSTSHVPKSKRVRPSKRPAVPIPKFSQTSSVRRGRCEHIGGILASVLEKYGIGIDQLIAEIEKPSH